MINQGQKKMEPLKMKKYQYILWFMAAFTIVSCESKNKIPASMQYNNKPIDPRCFAPAFSTASSATEPTIISLKTCTQCPEDYEDEAKQTKIKRTSDAGYDRLTSHDQSFQDNRAYGYFKYKYVGSVGSTDVIEVEESGGGSGTLSNIGLIKRSGDQLEVSTLSSGDRASGGIANVEVKDNKITFKKYLTPARIASFAKDLIGEPLLFEKSLPDCMACYGGFGYFEFDPSSDKENKLTHVDIDLKKFSPKNDVIQKNMKQLVDQLKDKKTYSESEVEYVQLDVKNFTHLLRELKKQFSTTAYFETKNNRKK